MRRHAVPIRIAFYLALLLAGIPYLADSLLYQPSRQPLDAVVAAARADRLLPWPSAVDYRGLIREPDMAARATLLLFHGNAGQAGDRSDYAERLGRLGLRVILVEYPGYGPRDGRIDEAAWIADGLATLQLARRQFGGPVVLAGESLGAAVAAGVDAAAARSGLPCSGLLLFTPWDTLAGVAAHHYPWLPVRWLLRGRWMSAERLAARSPSCPVLVVVAEEDRIVPAGLGRQLYAALPSAKRLVSVAGSDHNDWQAHVDEAWWRQQLAFVLHPGAE